MALSGRHPRFGKEVFHRGGDIVAGKPLLEETFEKLLRLERKIKEGKATREDLEQFRKLLSALEEGEKRLYKWYKEKVQTL